MHLLREEYLSPVTHRLVPGPFGGTASSLHESRAYQERDPTQIPPTHVTKYRHVTAAALEAVKAACAWIATWAGGFPQQKNVAAAGHGERASAARRARRGADRRLGEGATLDLLYVAPGLRVGARPGLAHVNKPARGMQGFMAKRKRA